MGGGRGEFLLDRQPAAGRPDWIVLQDPPPPSTTVPIVTHYLREDSRLIQCIDALARCGEFHLFDQQDAFFAPFTGFAGVKRPGPNFCAYEHANVTPHG